MSYSIGIKSIRKRNFIDNCLIFLIHCYKKYISPYKGFRCAYAVYFNDKSCSTWALQVTQEQGGLYLFKNLYHRACECQAAKLALSSRLPESQETQDNQKESDCNTIRPYADAINCCIGCIPLSF